MRIVLSNGERGVFSIRAKNASTVEKCYSRQRFALIRFLLFAAFLSS